MMATSSFCFVIDGLTDSQVLWFRETITVRRMVAKMAVLKRVSNRSRIEIVLSDEKNMELLAKLFTQNWELAIAVVPFKEKGC
jgi:hypothetical protein